MKTDAKITKEETCYAPTCCGEKTSSEANDASSEKAESTQRDDSKDAEIKAAVKKKYAAIAVKNDPGCGCGPDCCDSENETFSMIGDAYKDTEGHVEEADLGLGCGLPTEHAGLKEGQVVVDLGSGAGNDCFIARSIVGETGRVIGIDMTQEMIDLGKRNSERLNFSNVEHILGEIEAVPLEDNLADVVVSNCVMNLVPNKAKAFAETYRILKPNGHFSISDIVFEGHMPDFLREVVDLYTGCVSGATPKANYLNTIAEAGFENIEVKTSREIEIPQGILDQHLSKEQQIELENLQVLSVTVNGRKPI